MTTHLVRVPLADVDEHELASLPGRSVFQTTAWLAALAETHGTEPIAARVVQGGEPTGWFFGTRTTRFGVGVLGSPLPGTSTSYQGFASEQPIDGREHLPALVRFARALGCVHVEVMDRRLVGQVPPRFAETTFHSFEIELDEDEAVLWRMRGTARRNVEVARRRGISVEEVAYDDPGDFATELAGQIAGAAARRGQRPSFGRERISTVIRHLGPTGNLLLLRARDADGRTASTGMFPGLPGHTAFLWAGGSDPDLWQLRPNELLMSEALRTWRARGAVRFDLGGGDYKVKYGPTAITVPWLRTSLVPGLEHGRRWYERRVRRALGRSIPS